MKHRTLGRTGYEVSQLGFGAMRLPMKGETVDRDLAVPMIHRAFESGINYIDTAVFYNNGDSQRAVGDALKGWRDKVVLSTKNHYYEEDEGAWRKNLEDSLERLQTDHIDVYNTHGVGWGSYQNAVEPRIGKWLQKAKDEGLILHICTSFHDNNDALRNIVDTGFYESVTLQYNMLDRQLEDGIAYAHEKGMGVVVMGPVGGGRLGVPSDVLTSSVEGARSVPDLALRFVLSNPNVTVALSGMSTIQHVDENVATANEDMSMSESDKKQLLELLAKLKEMSDLYCSGCGYCKGCPAEVNIPQVFQRYNEARVYGLWDHSREAYAGLVKSGKGADQCTECGACLEKCPQKLPIPDRLKECHEALKEVAAK